MKKATTYLFVFVLALLVFYGGAGVNIISYCCGDCEAEGVEVLLDKDCCDVHEHVHCEAMPADGFSACSDMQASVCDIERVSFDWNSVALLLPDMHPAVFDLFSFGTFSVSLVPSPILNRLTAITPTGPPVLSPRVYLSLLTTLLI